MPRLFELLARLSIAKLLFYSINFCSILWLICIPIVVIVDAGYHKHHYALTTILVILSAITIPTEIILCFKLLRIDMRALGNLIMGHNIIMDLEQGSTPPSYTERTYQPQPILSNIAEQSTIATTAQGDVEQRPDSQSATETAQATVEHIPVDSTKTVDIPQTINLRTAFPASQFHTTEQRSKTETAQATVEHIPVYLTIADIAQMIFNQKIFPASQITHTAEQRSTTEETAQSAVEKRPESRSIERTDQAIAEKLSASLHSTKTAQPTDAQLSASLPSKKIAQPTDKELSSIPSTKTVQPSNEQLTTSIPSTKTAQPTEQLSPSLPSIKTAQASYE